MLDKVVNAQKSRERRGLKRRGRLAVTAGTGYPGAGNNSIQEESQQTVEDPISQIVRHSAQIVNDSTS